MPYLQTEKKFKKYKQRNKSHHNIHNGLVWWIQKVKYVRSTLSHKYKCKIKSVAKKLQYFVMYSSHL